jgi:hypothetical protein
MPLEFALRPRFDLNRPPKRRRFSGLHLPPLALPIAAYWLAIAGGTYALVRSPEASDESRHDAMSDGARIDSSDAPATWRARLEISESAAVPTNRASEPAAVATPQAPVPRRELPASVHEAPRLTRRQAPAPEPWFPLEPAQEPAQRQTEVPSREFGAEGPRREPPPTSLPSCEGAADAANQTIDLGASRGAPDLTRDAFAAVLENGTYLGPCAVPARMALEVCAAVQDGKVVGVTVATEPRDVAISACVRRAVAALRFPRNPGLDVTRTRFESTR